MKVTAGDAGNYYSGDGGRSLSGMEGPYAEHVQWDEPFTGWGTYRRWTRHSTVKRGKVVDEQEAIAKAIATIAHRGQVDKAGNPYIDHPARVAYSVKAEHQFVDGYRAVAWLHDVLEDTDVTRDDLRSAGVDGSVIADVVRLTRVPDQFPEEYYELITGSYRARMVKLADIADNTDPGRLALLDDATIARLTRKYAKARLLLGAAS